MQAILEKLGVVIDACQKRLAEVDIIKKDYDKKCDQMVVAEAQLKSGLEAVQLREDKVKHVEDIVEYSEGVAKQEKDLKQSIVDLTPKIKKYENDLKAFHSFRDNEVKVIENAKKANKKQAEALIKEKADFDKKMTAFRMAQGL